MSKQQDHDKIEQEVYMTTLYSAANAIQGAENYTTSMTTLNRKYT